MPFKPGDININRAGRIRPKTELKPSEIRSQELLSLLRKIKPHMSKAIMTAAEIMNKEEAAEASRLRACTILLDAYRDLLQDVYDDDSQDVEEIQESAKPVFSLRMIDKSEDEKKE